MGLNIWAKWFWIILPCLDWLQEICALSVGQIPAYVLLMNKHPLRWLAAQFFVPIGVQMKSVRILDRTNTLGLTYASPITTQTNPTVIRRQTSCSNFNTSTHWTTCGLTLYSDGRYWPGTGLLGVLECNGSTNTSKYRLQSGAPTTIHLCSSDGLIIIQGNGGELFVLAHSGGVTSQAPTATSTVTPTRAASTPTPTSTPVLPTVTVLPTTPAVGTGTPQVTTLTSSTTQVPQYQRMEVTFQLNKIFPVDLWLPYYYYDPSDPVGVNGITIDARMRAPSGREITVPAFYYQDYIRSGTTHVVMTPTTNTSWKIRFAPEELGDYSSPHYGYRQKRNFSIPSDR